MKLFGTSLSFDHIIPFGNGMWRMWLFSFISLLLAGGTYFSHNWIEKAVANTVNVQAPAIVQEEPFSPEDPFVRRDVDVVIAVDLSASTCAINPSDPEGMRLRAAEMLIGSLAADIFPRKTNIALFGFSDAEAEQGQDWWDSLTPVEDAEKRERLMIRAANLGCGAGTDIGAVVERARVELFESSRRVETNIPAFILLSDGEPDPPNGPNAPNAIIESLIQLTDQGTLVSLVTLRGEGKRPDNDKFRDWRRRCVQLAEENSLVDYYEAKEADELESIYNAIRQRLVREGAPPGDRQEFNPQDLNAHITMPPNLLKAVLTISKTEPDTDVDLIAPDGHSVSELIAENPAAVEVVGTRESFYRVYTLRRPESGQWTLRTPAPVAYVLNPESLYSARIFFPSGEAYLNAAEPTQLQIVVVDENGSPANLEFDLQVTLSRLRADQEGNAVVDERPLPTPVYDTTSGFYVTTVNPNNVEPGLIYDVEVTGSHSNGTLLNTLRVQLDAVNAPGDIDLEMPEQLICENLRPVFNPPAFECHNVAEARLQFDPGVAQIQPEEVIFLDPTQETIKNAMNPVAANVYSATTGLLFAPGDYAFRAEVTGNSGTGKPFTRRAMAQTQVVLPAWVGVLQERLVLASYLLLALGIWKPLITPILLFTLRLLKVSGIGYYSTSSSTHSRSVFGQMLKKRRLFGLSDTDITRWGASIRVDRQLNKTMRRLKQWFPFIKRWTDHDHSDIAIRAFPFGTWYIEDGRVNAVNNGNISPAQVKLGNRNLWVRKDKF